MQICIFIAVRRTPWFMQKSRRLSAFHLSACHVMMLPSRELVACRPLVVIIVLGRQHSSFRLSTKQYRLSSCMYLCSCCDCESTVLSTLAPQSCTSLCRTCPATPSEDSFVRQKQACNARQLLGGVQSERGVASVRQNHRRTLWWGCNNCSSHTKPCC